MRFFTSDLHFWHKNISAFCNRPWSNLEAMNEGLIANWNTTVAPGDQVYILGDMFFCGTIKAKEILKRLAGKKYLILGNHDWGKVKKHRAQEFGFEWAEDHFRVRIGPHDVSLSHFPFKGSGDHTEGEERFTERRLEDKGQWLLHGHVHNGWKINGRQINVGVDVWDYRPVAEHTILDIKGWFKGVGKC